MRDDTTVPPLAAFEAEGEPGPVDPVRGLVLDTHDWVVISGDDARRALEAFEEERALVRPDELPYLVVDPRLERAPHRPSVADNQVSMHLVSTPPRASRLTLSGVAAARRRTSDVIVRARAMLAALSRGERYLAAAFLPAAALAAFIGSSLGAGRADRLGQGPRAPLSAAGTAVAGSTPTPQPLLDEARSVAAPTSSTEQTASEATASPEQETGGTAPAFPPAVATPVAPPALPLDRSARHEPGPGARPSSVDESRASVISIRAPEASDAPAVPAAPPALPAVLIQEEPVVIPEAPLSTTTAPARGVTPTPIVASRPGAETPAPGATDAVRTALERYRAAFSALDSTAAAAVWPRANVKSLSRAFDQLLSQQIDFAGCSIDVKATVATAECSGAATYVPRVGSRSPRTEDRHWQFALLRVDDRWVIDTVTVR